MELSFVQKMNLAVKADEESLADPIDNLLSRIGDASELNQPPSFDAVISKLDMDEARISSDAENSKQQRVQDQYSSAPYAVKAPVANAHIDNAAFCNGSHSCPMRVVSISSGSIQFPDGRSIPSSLEKSHSYGKNFSDALPTAVERGYEDAESGQNL
ncbi:hypothetical protein Nepgr_022896 [Nepenthes gracilis]|uniref:Uncharacterized protein n=1 Tax=Nepenthes gracilis TaxID=150966 RepID=A0AAD3T1M5_NEPGR|nr:hypothetical protein Nepgr_022896 [Nepenthes gracilis]